MNNMTKKFFDPFSPREVNMIPVILDRMELFGITRTELAGMYDEYIINKKEKLKLEAIKIEQQTKEIIDREDKANAVPSVLGERKKRIKYSSKVCQKCGSSVRYFNVNSCKGSMIGGDYKTARLCTNKDCMYTEYK